MQVPIAGTLNSDLSKYIRVKKHYSKNSACSAPSVNDLVLEGIIEYKCLALTPSDFHVSNSKRGLCTKCHLNAHRCNKSAIGTKMGRDASSRKQAVQIYSQGW